MINESQHNEKDHVKVAIHLLWRAHLRLAVDDGVGLVPSERKALLDDLEDIDQILQKYEKEAN